MALYGIDSNTSTFRCGTGFYAGRLGYGTKADSTYFNSTAAKTVGPARTYAYWGLQGPTADPNFVYPDVTAASAWGRAQADAFHSARQNTTLVGTRTVFADVEPAFGGWLDPNVGNNKYVNHAVYSGFLNRVEALGYTKGVYSSIGSWGDIMANQYAAPATIEWAASYPCCPSDPAANCPMCPTTFSPTTFGGLDATIWQYYGWPGIIGCDVYHEDWDMAISLPG